MSELKKKSVINTTSLLSQLGEEGNIEKNLYFTNSKEEGSLSNKKGSKVYKRSLQVFSSFATQLKFRNYMKKIIFEKNEVEYVLKKENIVDFFKLLKLHTFLQYQVLSDILAIDYPGNMKKRFQLNYQMLSLSFNSRLNIVVKLGELETIPSITKFFSGASWFEREVYDLFGIFFSGHPDLRRILTDYGFEGHPLRKDFPLTGYFELFFSDIDKRIIYQPVSLAQEYRYFHFNRQWINDKSTTWH